MIGIIYWSGTGNTEQMANVIAEAAQAKGGDVKVMEVSEFDPADAEKYEVLAFGCPAMGDEVLEEDEFQPMWDEVKTKLEGKKAALFGSYSWADGEWMEKWDAEAKELGINLVAESLPVYEAPEGESEDKCKAFGEALVG
ncbi:MAG: flavodoxin [Eubacteriales bacterium]|nr:flavodoxin [Eubacteriales bacterium]